MATKQTKTTETLSSWAEKQLRDAGWTVRYQRLGRRTLVVIERGSEVHFWTAGPDAAVALLGLAGI